MPDLPAWIATLERFAAHLRALIDQRIKSGSLDADAAEELGAVLTVAPPADPAALADLCRSLPYALPKSLRDLFVHGSAEISFHYFFDLGDAKPAGFRSRIHGGELPDVPDPIFSVEKLPAYLADAREYADVSGISDFPEVQEIWKRAIPFHRFNNADFLAFDPVEDPVDPYVIHLDHEGEPKLIARNLAGFLREWPRVCYVGPGEIYALEKFFDPTTGILSGDVPRAVALRQALQWTP
jgi:hypothetical protein